MPDGLMTKTPQTNNSLSGSSVHRFFDHFLRTFFTGAVMTVTALGLFADDVNANAASSEPYVEVVIFDADKDNPRAFHNSSAPKSDYLARVEPTTIADGKKCLGFSYTGTKGQARSSLQCGNIVQEVAQSGANIVGVKFVIDYAESDHGRLNFVAMTSSGGLNRTEPLQNGTHEYLFLTGYPFGGKAAKWPLMTSLGIWNFAECAHVNKFKLLKISLLTLKTIKGTKELEIIYTRPIKEILFSSSPLKDDGSFNPDFQWNKLAGINEFDRVEEGKRQPATSTVKANIGYDQENLFLRVEAEYPTKPLSAVKENDLDVWQDESLELFFDSLHTDVRNIQFAINADGVTFDWLKAFDTVAAAIIKNVQWSLPHKKHISYENGKIAYDLVLPLKELNGGNAKPPFIGFQMVQDYNNRESQNLFSLRWANKPKRTPNADTSAFGFLVYNREPFGAGNIKAEKVEWIPVAAKNECDFNIKLELSGFADGTYTITQWLMSPDHTVAETSGELTLKGDRDLTCFFPKAKNLNGAYAWVLGIKNKSGNTKLLAINFNNETELIDLFGQDIIWPRPKKVFWAANGAFNAGEKHTIAVLDNASARTLLTAKLFQEKLLGYAGSEYKIEKGSAKDIVLRIADEVTYNGKTEKLKPEGYHLKVTPELVEITGSDNAGLYYGTLTFIQLLKMPMKRLDTAPVKCVEILDWPDLGLRNAIVSYLPDQLGGKVEEKTDVVHLLSWIDRFVAGNKFNTFTIIMDSMTVFKRRPEVNWNLANRDFTLQDWKKVSDYCRERFIKIIPVLPAGGHDYWLGMANPEFHEKGWSDQANVAHPDYWPTYRDCLLDIIEATGCEYFRPALDEWWHGRRAGENPEELLYGKTRAQVMLDFLLKLHQFCKERNIKLVIFEDMLNPMHNGRRYEVYRIIDQLPKDIVINPWAFSGGVGPCTEYFANKGFSNMWACNTIFKNIPEKNKRAYSGFGTAIYAGYGGGGESTTSVGYIFNWMAHWFRGADYAWNFYQGNESSIDDEISSGVLPALSALYAGNPNPYASQDIVPIDISSSLDTSFAQFVKDRWPVEYKNGASPVMLPEGEKTVGNIPTVFSKGAKNCVIVDQKQNVDFPVSGKFSSLIFLQSAMDLIDSKKELAGFSVGFRTWHMKLPLGSYLIEYADGTTSKFIVHLGSDLYYLKMRPLGGGTVYNRCIYTLKDTNGANIFLYQSEWVNPYPEKEITKVSFADEARIPLKTVIFAISGRKVKQTAGYK